MQFEGEYLCGFVLDTARRFVDVGDAILADLVAEDVTIFIVAVEPKIGRLEILFVDEFTFDLEIGEVVVCAPILTCLRPVPGDFGWVFKRHGWDMTGLARNSMQDAC